MVQAACFGGEDGRLDGTGVFVGIDISVADWLAFKLLIPLVLRAPRRRPALALAI
jgi:hypothetical protein